MDLDKGACTMDINVAFGGHMGHEQQHKCQLQ